MCPFKTTNETSGKLIKGCWVRSRDQTNLKNSPFFSLFLSPKYHCGKLCLVECCLQKESDSDNRFSDVSCTSLFGSRAWEQTLLPDAVPVCSWKDIKVLVTRQAWLLGGWATLQPYHCWNGHPDLDCLLWIYIKERGCGCKCVCVYIIKSTCMNKLS